MLSIIPVRGIPNIKKGDDLGKLLVTRLKEQGDTFQPGDITVVAQKIVSKAEGRVVSLSRIAPSDFAKTIASNIGKDPRQVEVILRETEKMVRMKGGHLITETKQGFICANAGVDQSNVGDRDSVTLLPQDSDASADRIPAAIIRGYKAPKGHGRAKDLLRPEEIDLFR